MGQKLSRREGVKETQQREVPGAQEMSWQGTRSGQELYQGQSPTEAEPAAAAPAGAAEEEEKPPEPLVPEAEKAAEPPAPREELPSAGTQSSVPAPPSPPGCSQALLDLAWSISGEMVSQALLHIQGCRQQPEEQRHLGEREDPAGAARGPAEMTEGPVPAPHSTPSPSSAPLGAQDLWEEPERAVLALSGPVLSQHWSLEALAPDSDWDSDSEEESPVPAPHRTPSPLSAPLGAQALWEELERAVLALAGPVLSQHWSLEALAPDSDWSSNSEEEEEEVEPELSQGTVSLIQELSQEEDDVSSSSGEKPVGPVKEGDTQPSPPEGPSSASPVGTEVAAEAAPALPSASPLPGSPTEAEPAAAAPSGAAEEAAAGSGLAVQEKTDDSNEEMKFWQFLYDLEPFLVGDPELSQEVSYYEQYTEEDLPHGVVSSSQGPSNWEEYPEQVLCGGDVVSCEELSDWEEHLGQEVSRGNGSRPSGLSSWGDDSDTGLVQENWPQHVILAKPLCPEDDEWDDVSLLELPPEDGKHQKREVLVAEGLPVPVPREAWAECPAQEPCSQGPAPAPHSPPAPGLPGWEPRPSAGSRLPPGNVPPASGGRCGRCGGCSAVPASDHAPRSKTGTEKGEEEEEKEG
nr:fibrous sheath CABYR-binding protein-like [Taeniopygia guttata]